MYGLWSGYDYYGKSILLVEELQCYNLERKDFG